ncbi:ATP-binding protein [Kitasatospora sp. NE20-6]|uniref:ATP-binding protein n=1 Tax=Kitasatospora sp. NE20-6 TaxID=2859066 RepID=UPI0038B3F6A0
MPETLTPPLPCPTPCPAPAPSTSAPAAPALPGAARQECWLPRHRKSAGAARRRLRAYLAARPGSGPLADAAEQLVGELVANAVGHGSVPPGRLVLVAFEYTGGALCIEVHDACADEPVLRTPGEADESGRGLRVVEALAAEWGVRARAGGVGKVVWCVCRPGGAER